jgi:short subunit dehydrogenase-like uncharacterized protein
MKKKIISSGLALLFFGAITFSGIAATNKSDSMQTVIDKDKNKKAKRSSKKECKAKKSCCDYDQMKKSDCHKKKGGEDK